MQAVNLTHEWYEHCYLKEKKNSFSFTIRQLKNTLKI